MADKTQYFVVERPAQVARMGLVRFMVTAENLAKFRHDEAIYNLTPLTLISEIVSKSKTRTRSVNNGFLCKTVIDDKGQTYELFHDNTLALVE